MTSTGERRERRTTRSLGDAPRSMWFGLAVGVLGFVARLSMSSSTTVNGEVVACSFFDVGALGAAVACLLCAVHAIVARLRLPERYPMHLAVVLGVSGVVLVLGAVHILRAFGVIGGFC